MLILLPSGVQLGNSQHTALNQGGAPKASICGVEPCFFDDRKKRNGRGNAFWALNKCSNYASRNKLVWHTDWTGSVFSCVFWPASALH